MGTAAGRWVWPICFYRCVLFLHISVQCGPWCVVVVCTGGCGGAFLHVFQSLVYAGCARGFVGGGWSLWTRMFVGVVGVTALGWALGLQCRYGTS